MATYVPNAYDATQPTEDKSVESAALEFRTVKVELVKIDTVYAGMAAVTTVANDLNEPISEIETVATNIANVNVVGTDIANVNTVAGNSVNINAVAANSADITSVAGINANVTTVAGNTVNVNIVATDIANINSVAADIVNVDAVAGNSVNINAAVANSTNINAAVANAANINAVVADAADINTVVANLPDINTVAANVVDVTNFADVYLGPAAVAPLVRNDSTPLQIGDLYFSTVVSAMQLYTATGWQSGFVEVSNFVTKTGNTGAAALPAGTTAQRDGAPVVGATRFNTTLNSPEIWNGTEWAPMGGGATGAPGNYVFVENDQSVTADYTLTAGKNAMTAGPITINSGVTVTVPTGATWSIV